jgi:hypothetical protein
LLTQIGLVGSVQSAAARQGTHSFTATSQTGVVPEQCVASAAVHSTHFPSLALHAGRAPSLAAQAAAAAVPSLQATQVCSEPQTGLLAPVHWLLPVHSTHLPVSVAQTGWAGFLAWQASVAAPVAAQPAQAPATQMGLVGSEQSLLARQATHLLVLASQSGVLPEQCLLSVQATHRPVSALQAGVAARRAQVTSDAHLPQM